MITVDVQVFVFSLLLMSYSAIAFATQGRGGVFAASAFRVLTRRDLTVNVLVVGSKSKTEHWISTGIEEYETRLRGKARLDVNTLFVKGDEELEKKWNSTKGIKIAMDEGGKQFTSRQFSKYFNQALVDGGSTVTFCIGGAAGLPPSITNSSADKISLSKMTLPHQMARLLLVEQMYRATEIARNTGYHKD